MHRYFQGVISVSTFAPIRHDRGERNIMPKFIITATDAKHKRETRRVVAETARDAVAQVEAEGGTEIVLHTDDVMAHTIEMSPEKVDENEFTAADFIQMRYASKWTFFLFVLKKLYWKVKWSLAVIVVIWLWYERLSSHPFVKAFLIISTLGIPFLIAAHATFFGWASKFDALLEDYAWGRWQKVIQGLPPLKHKIPRLEYFVLKAGSLAGLRKNDKALALMKTLEGAPDIPRWMYLGRLAEIYVVAGDSEAALNRVQQAYEEDPENPTLQLDLALALLKNDAEIDRAAALIETAEKQPLNEFLTLMLPMHKGFLAGARKQYADAERLLRTAIENLKPASIRHPSVRQLIDLLHGQLAIVLARQKDFRGAEEHFKIAFPRLCAIKADHIINRYKTANPQTAFSLDAIS